MLGPLDGNLVLPLADGALHPEHQLLRGLRLLPQDGLRLASKALLLAVVPVTQRRCDTPRYRGDFSTEFNQPPKYYEQKAFAFSL